MTKRSAIPVSFAEAMRILSRLLGRAVLICLVVWTNTPVAAQISQDQAEQVARAAELLQKARAAIGRSNVTLWGLSASAKLKTSSRYISVQSPSRVVEKMKILGGSVEVDFSFPDRFRKRVSTQTISGRRYSYTDVVNGARAWRNPPPPIISSYRDSRVIDVSDIERSREKYANDARQQIAYYSLGWLLEAPPSLQCEFIYAGQVREENRLLEAIIVKGPNGFRPVLLLDQATFLPFAIVVAFVEAKRETVLVEVATLSRRFRTDTYARARREREARRTPAKRRELQWRFSNHQSVGGLVLPHRITMMIDGEVADETTINHFKVNQPIDPKRFEGQPEVK